MFQNRSLNLTEITRSRSVFLLGPRQTGKSSLIRHTLPKEIPLFDLLDHTLFASLAANPSLMRQQLEAQNYTQGLVVIDEIQKLPELLNEIHLLIEKHSLRFLMTGSSARKLRRAGTNLLGGRASQFHLHPLTYHELGPRFDLIRALNFGLLPSVYFSDQPRSNLRDYVGLYLDLEIQQEASIRDISSFSRFLSVAALCNGQIINYSSIASDAREKRKTVTGYFQILEDTLIGDEVSAWSRSRKRKAMETSKFYLFDVGVARAINDLPDIKFKSKDFGDAFEHFICQEIRAYIDYYLPNGHLNYWRSTSNLEVDFVLNHSTAIEVKAKDVVSHRDLRGIRALMEENLLKKYVVVSLEPKARLVGHVLILPWEEFLKSLWAHEWD